MNTVVRTEDRLATERFWSWFSHLPRGRRPVRGTGAPADTRSGANDPARPAVHASPPEAHAAPAAHPHQLLARIHVFVERHLDDPRLSPAMIARAHNISDRSLYRLFQDESVTVSQLIHRRRLERCRDDLADPGNRDRPIHAIAARWGFGAAAHFTRAFRAAYGLSPREYRHRYAPCPPSEA
ncbi:helix-turn-helix domain-containing protein [Streptosporangium sp. DT93]|uniref:helix-turn-helix domain-containing protein n=1 Tax=Streptosporangium sp. DT93 TaxID=3393428 RepID=UPI003CF6547D